MLCFVTHRLYFDICGNHTSECVSSSDTQENKTLNIDENDTSECAYSPLSPNAGENKTLDIDENNTSKSASNSSSEENNTIDIGKNNSSECALGLHTAGSETFDAKMNINSEGCVSETAQLVNAVEDKISVEALLADLQSLAALSTQLVRVTSSMESPCNQKDFIVEKETPEVNIMENEASETAFKNQMESLNSGFIQDEEVSRHAGTNMDNNFEISSRTNETLKECYILLHRLTDEEIQYYESGAAFYGSSEISDDIRSKTEELLCKTVEAVSDNEDMPVAYRKDGNKRSVRALKKNSEVFERYKRKRQGFLNRRNKPSHSENSLDWSQDEFRSLSDDTKKKKKCKRGRKYEHDFEWSPYTSKNILQNNKKLRSHARRPIFESESSSTDEEDILFNTFINGDTDGEYYFPKTAFHTPVPSEFNHENVSTPVKIASGENVFKNYASETYGTLSVNEDFSHNSDSTLQKCNSEPGDIVSSIIEDMDQLQSNKLKSFKNTLQRHNTLNNRVKVIKKGRKRLKLSSMDKTDNVNKEVKLLLKRIITDVCAELKVSDGGRGKFYKSCKWCTTKFCTSKNSVILCDICRDFKMGGKSVSASRTFNSVKTKPMKENKCKKVSKTMSQVLKNLPKNERQRLMYVEKTDKMPVEKGYNHCRSFITPRDANENIYSNKTLILPKGIEIINKKNEFKRKSSSSPVITNQDAKTSISPDVKSNKQVEQRIISKEESQKKKCVSLKKFNDGLFLMTFPDPDEELDILDKTPQLQKRQVTANNLNNSEVVQTSSKNPTIVCSKTNRQQSINNKQYDTYLFPPVPTVIVSNYSSDTDSLNLSHTYYQNEITHQHAHKNSNALSGALLVEKSALSNKVSNANGLACISVATSSQNSSRSTLSKNTTFTITSKNLNQLKSFTVQSVSVLKPQTSVAVPLMPVISSVMSIPGMNTIQTNTLKENVPSNAFSSTNFNDLQIRISEVTSQNVDPFSSNSGVLGSAVNKLTENTKSNEISISRSNRNSSECFETMEHENLCVLNQEISETNNTISKLGTEDHTEQSLLDHSNSSKSSEIKENICSQSTFASIIDVLDAVSILAVIDLEKNPQSALNFRIQRAKNHLAKLTNEKNTTPEHTKKLADCQYNLQLLNIARRYLNLYGSFTKVSDFLLRKAQMIQIKKEILEESNQSSCMFSQSSHLNNSIPSSDSDLTRSTETPVATNSKQNDQASVNHIQKIQSQIAAMNNAQLSHYGLLPSGGTVHHYPTEQIASLPPAVGAPTPVTPRNDCLVGDSRETPSRGSGPRTPARPESAASQSEEQTLVQIKKEQFEATSSPTTQCAFPQNTTLPQVSSQLPVVQEMPSMNMSEHSVNSTVLNLPISNTNQTNLHVQSREIVPNRTVIYNNNQNYSDVLLNIATKHSISVTPATSNTQINQNRPVLVGQQMFIQNGSGLCPKQAVPSVNTNQYVVRPPPYTSANTGGTVIVNNPQVAQNALLTNVSNQQFYTTNQVSQLYYPPSSQITCISSNNLSTVSTPDLTATQIQQAELSPERMICAVCKSQATLRCKQCARVAYCNTTCAKTYWHQKHKMECKPLGS